MTSYLDSTRSSVIGTQLKLHRNHKHAREPSHRQAEDHACIIISVATNQDMFRERNAETKEENAEAPHDTPSLRGVDSHSHEQSKGIYILTLL